MNNQMPSDTYCKVNNLLKCGTITASHRIRADSSTENIAVVDSAGDRLIRCYICGNQCKPSTPLTKMCTKRTSTRFPNKLAQLMGEAFKIIVCAEDHVCLRCTKLVNFYDALETEIVRVKTNLIGLLNKKYDINEDVDPKRRTAQVADALGCGVHSTFADGCLVE